MQWLNSIESLDSNIIESDYPFLSKGFLRALEATHNINGQTGWNSHHLFDDQNQYFAPAFIKHHSYGEYVFDWGWADAYQRHGIEYYPKLLLAAPFTPTEGNRIYSPNFEFNGQYLSAALHNHCAEENLSGCHILYCNNHEIDQLEGYGWHTRYSTQFHWYNYDYSDFDDFLTSFKSRKRKTVLKERQSIREQNIDIQWIEGKNITPEQWEFFYYCYQLTYAKRGMQGYINLDGFKALQKEIATQIQMVVANKENEPIACALFFQDSKNLYGRYWGCTQDIPNLHFEVCYYQGIEYCIQHGLEHFDPGTQGEHKISRGFEPVFKRSLHYLRHEGFHDAVGSFVKEEYESLKIYKEECYRQLPFNDASRPEPK